MPTPVFLTGFEYGVATPNVNGGGLFNTITGSPGIQSTVKNTGNYALRLNPSGAIYTVFKNLASPNIVVGRLYFRYNSWPGIDNEIVYVPVAAGVNLAIKLNVTTKKLFARFWSTSSSSDHATTLSLNTWYRLDFRFDSSTGTSKIDFKLDDVALTQFTLSQTATTFSSIALGPSNSDTMDLFIDDVIVSTTTADYPIGPGGTEALVPTSDGTHNAGTNVIEDNAGTDIGVTTAWNKLNSIPPSSTNYIRQATIGGTNYAEVLFGDISAVHSSILGAFGILAYTSATTTANNGSCVVSKDSFSTNTSIHGTTSTPADMSDGSTANLFYKSALLANVIDDTTVNALKARVGYSRDVTPNPYWVDLIVEVAYGISNNISLDLVSYTTTINDISVLESELISLDLVIYTTTVNDISTVESGSISLDLVSYTSSIGDITVLENELIVLDLVSYTSSIGDITVLENELIVLDLVSYTSSIGDITVLENELIVLDLVSYNTVISDITITEGDSISLDLVTYTSNISDIVILESELITLDPVSYTTSISDIMVLESEVITLDLVSYVTNIFDIDFDFTSNDSYLRYYLIFKEYRWNLVQQEHRTNFVEKEERIFLIN